ncbi:hypothetical protein E4U03_07855 [Rothia nasimurium]|uniref:Abi-like protein n=1 Tax=Rothia nasimurium TaxID=85336 RepID=A0A4Y9F421_9MICC|nr:hypothetical protein [Rothia nasimurium]MBF0808522.1 hypothetical protein [Rothia nasimurium]TFU21825.1 hypothetical protein E4U03_07855 [Rothia nasimurium]
MGNKKVSVEELEVWFSEPRLHRYRMYRNPEHVYHWNAHITKELLVDIGHLEILLRNAVDRALRQDDRYGTYWFQNTALPLSYQAQKSVVKAVERATRRGTRPLDAGRVIAELPFDFWRYLFSKYYQATVWPKFASCLSTKVSRVEFERHLNFVYINRNRFSHHEPIVKGSYEEDLAYVQSLLTSIYF